MGENDLWIVKFLKNEQKLLKEIKILICVLYIHGFVVILW